MRPTRHSRSSSCQTEFVAKVGAILATRRRRAANDPEIWAAHYAVVEGEVIGAAQVETDRARFLGRGRGVRAPIAVMDGGRLSNTVGMVLDPVFALRYRLRIQSGHSARIAFWTLDRGFAREAVLDLVDKHHDPNAYVRAATLAWTQAQVQLRHLGIDAEEAGLFQRLASPVLYANASLRPVIRDHPPRRRHRADAVDARRLRGPADRACADR